MNCYFHSSAPAVSQCAHCGVGLCKDCTTNAVYSFDNKPVCLNCSENIAQEDLSNAQKSKNINLGKAIFSGVFLLIALIVYASGNEPMAAWCIAGIAGIPAAFKASRRSKEQRIMDEVHDRHESDMMSLMMGWFIRLIIKVAVIIALAPICAAYSFVSSLVKFFNGNKKISEAQNAYDVVMAMKQRVANMPFEESVQTTQVVAEAAVTPPPFN